LLKDAPILVLDEPTEGLDGETEAQIIEALERMTAGRTTLVITHRPALLRLADSAVLMAEGRIAVQGVPANALDISPCKLTPPQRAVHRQRRPDATASDAAVLASFQGRSSSRRLCRWPST
jgi:ABC-type multidrug transport system ATPase subunit